MKDYKEVFKEAVRFIVEATEERLLEVLESGELAKLLDVKSGKSLLLKLLGTVAVPAIEEFTVGERFVVDTSEKTTVKISRIWDNFRKWFLDTRVPSTEATTLYKYRLQQDSLDSMILDYLGGEEKAEITLAHVFALMRQQPNGENGELLTNGYANIFYVRDITGVVRAVYVRWHDYGWDVSALEVSFPYGWFEGSHVFSRNPVPLES